MKFSERLAILDGRQVAQAARLDALQSQVEVILGMLKETIMVQQLLYQKQIITRDEVKDELEKQQAILTNRLEEARKQATLQSEDAGTDEDSSGDAEPGVLPDEGGGGDRPRPKLWTPGGYV